MERGRMVGMVEGRRKNRREADDEVERKQT